MYSKKLSRYTVYAGKRTVDVRDAVSSAQAVRDYLRMRGCSSDEISTVGSNALMWRGAVFSARKTGEAP